MLVQVFRAESTKYEVVVEDYTTLLFPRTILQDSAIGRPLRQAEPVGNYFLTPWSEHEQLMATLAPQVASIRVFEIAGFC